jgi:hypothetical protein
MSNLYEQKKKLLRKIKDLKKKESLEQDKDVFKPQIHGNETTIVKKSHYSLIKSLIFQSEKNFC